MKQSVKDIISLIKSVPELWEPYSYSNIHESWDSIKYQGIRLENYGNSRLFSVLRLYIHNKEVALSPAAQWKMESIVMWWFENCPLSKMQPVVDNGDNI